MANPQGKAISELGSTETYMDPNDLALISQRQSNNTYSSKAVKKEAFEKLTIAGDRDATTRNENSYKVLQFVDSSSAHLGTSYIQAAFYANGENVTQLITRKKIGGDQVDGIIGLIVQPNKSRYGYCTAEGFGIGPQPTNTYGANVYIQGSDGAIELRPGSAAAHGGHIDFHYAGSTADYTSRIVEDAANFQMVSTNKNVLVKADGTGKQVILNASANNSILQNPPTQGTDAKNSKAIATVGWVASNFLPTGDLFDDPTELIETLAGLLNKQDLVIYVDKTSTLESTGTYVLKSINTSVKGVFLTKTATKQTPVKSIYDAIEIAKKIKFLEGAKCYIRLLTDQDFYIDQNKHHFRQIDFSHPDLVQDKRFIVDGWDGGQNYDSSRHEYNGTNGDFAIRKISLDLRQPAVTLNNQYYQSPISINCSVTFRHIVFNGMLGMSHFNNGESFSLKSDFSRSSYFVWNSGGDAVRFEGCMFRGCETAFYGSNGYFTDTAFSFVQTCILGNTGSRTEIYNGLNVNYCWKFISAEFSSVIIFSVNAPTCKWKLQTAAVPISVSSAGNALITLYHRLSDSAVVPDPNGIITINGAKYSRAPSPDADQLTVNTNIAAFDFWRITIDSLTEEVVLDKKTVGGVTGSTVEEFMQYFIGREESSGYGQNGYIAVSYGHQNWLSVFSQSTAGWNPNDIPNVGTVAF